MRNIEDPKNRRNLELVMTADYSPVSFANVATDYREQVRHVIPTAIQDDIRRECGDRNVLGEEGAYFIVLPPTCSLRIEPALASTTAAALRARSDLVGELDWHLAAVAVFLENAKILAAPIRQLHQDLARSRAA